MDSSSIFSFAFYLYNILKEPIPFKIQCHILNHEQHYLVNHTNCSSLSFIDSDQLSIFKNDKRDNTFILFGSPPVTVKRQLTMNIFEPDKPKIPSKLF